MTENVIYENQFQIPQWPFCEMFYILKQHAVAITVQYLNWTNFSLPLVEKEQTYLQESRGTSW